MKSRTLLFAMVLLLLFPGIGRTEFLRQGNVICVSHEKLKEFLALVSSSKRDDQKINEYVLVNHWCAYPKPLKIQVRSIGLDGLVRIFLPDAGLEAWASAKAIGRREQPPRANVYVDPDHPDGASVCQMISNLTRSPSEPTVSIAKSVVETNSARVGAAARDYMTALQEKNFDLVTDWRRDKCVAELDAPGQALIACSIDQSKYWQCRQAHSSDAAVCYSDVCSTAATPSDEIELGDPVHR